MDVLNYINWTQTYMFFLERNKYTYILHIVICLFLFISYKYFEKDELRRTNTIDRNKSENLYICRIKISFYMFGTL